MDEAVGVPVAFENNVSGSRPECFDHVTFHRN